MQHKYMPMNAAALMDRVFDLYKDTFKIQIAFSLIIGIISFMLMMALGVIIAIGVSIAIAASGAFDERYILLAVVAVLIAILPLYMVWVYLSTSGHILISKQAFYGEPIELPFRDTFSAFLRVMSAGFAQIILSLPWLALLAVFIYSFAAGHDNLFYFLTLIHPLVIILFSLVFAVFYIIYSNIYALSIPVAIFERRLFFSTIFRSFTLLRGSFWRILCLRMLWMLLVFLFSYSAQGLVVVLVGALAVLAGNVIDFNTLWVATGPMQFYVSLFVGILVSPMEGIMTALIYFNQKIKKDGLDIEIVLRTLRRGLGAS